MSDTKIIFVNPMNNFLQANECVICLESTFPLSHNINCSCKYYYHQSCIDKLPKPTKCLMCKKEWVEPVTDDSDSCTCIVCIYSTILILILIIMITMYYMGH